MVGVTGIASLGRLGQLGKIKSPLNLKSLDDIREAYKSKFPGNKKRSQTLEEFTKKEFPDEYNKYTTFEELDSGIFKSNYENVYGRKLSKENFYEDYDRYFNFSLQANPLKIPLSQDEFKAMFYKSEGPLNISLAKSEFKKPIKNLPDETDKILKQKGLFSSEMKDPAKKVILSNHSRGLHYQDPKNFLTKLQNKDPEIIDSLKAEINNPKKLGDMKSLVSKAEEMKNKNTKLGKKLHQIVLKYYPNISQDKIKSKMINFAHIFPFGETAKVDRASEFLRVGGSPDVMYLSPGYVNMNIQRGLEASIKHISTALRAKPTEALQAELNRLENLLKKVKALSILTLEGQSPKAFGYGVKEGKFKTPRFSDDEYEELFEYLLAAQPDAKAAELIKSQNLYPYHYKEKKYKHPYLGVLVKEGGLINSDLTDTIPPNRGPMSDGIPLLDPEESIQRQHFVGGGGVGAASKLFGTLSKVPRAVARVGDIKRPTFTKPSTTSDVAVTQAVEDKPAMFLETVRVLEEAPDAKLAPNEWLSYVKGKGVSDVELDEFGLEPLLNNMMKTQKGSASFKKAEDNLKTVQEEGQNITRNFSDLMKTHRGDKTHPDVIAATEALQAHKLKVKQASDVLAKLKSKQRAATPLLSKTELLETYNKEMPKIDMDIAMAEPVSRGAKDITKMLTAIREKAETENLQILSNDARLLTSLHQPPQDRIGFHLRGKILDIMQGTNKSKPRLNEDGTPELDGNGEALFDVIPLISQRYTSQPVSLHTGQHFSEMWQNAFPKIYHTTNKILKEGHFDVLKNLVPAEDIAKLAKAKNISEEEAFNQLYQALNIFDRQVVTADVPIPFWTKKMLYRLGDMSEGRGFFFKSKKSPAHDGAQFIPGGSGYGELKFYFNFDTGAIRAAEKTYESGHFSGEVFKGNAGNSPFGWGRFSERIDENGRKILLMEEIQSDLHQQVAQKGYKYAPRLDKGDVLAEMGDFAGQLDKKMQTLESTRLRKDNIMQLSRAERELPENVAELKNIEKAMKKLVDDVKKLKAKVEEQKKLTGKTGKVHPDAPFKKSENYAKVFLQGLMKMAADKGYDGIALSTGKMKKAHGGIPKGGDKFYDEIGVKAMKRIAKKSGFKFNNTTIVDGNGYTWEKIPLIEMRDINTGQRIPGESTIPVYSKGGFVKQNMVRGYNNGY